MMGNRSANSLTGLGLQPIIVACIDDTLVGSSLGIIDVMRINQPEPATSISMSRFYQHHGIDAK